MLMFVTKPVVVNWSNCSIKSNSYPVCPTTTLFLYNAFNRKYEVTSEIFHGVPWESIAELWLFAYKKLLFLSKYFPISDWLKPHA